MVRNVNTNLEKLAFAGKYSMKNIPIPKKSEYVHEKTNWSNGKDCQKYEMESFILPKRGQ